MAEFLCRVATPSGEVFERSYVAANENALRHELESQDLMILNLRQRNPFLRELAQTFRLRRAVSAREFLLFNQEFSALIRAGLPILPSLEILLERRKNEVFKQALMDVRDRVRAGEALSEAFEAQGEMIPNLYCASLASGERSGELATVLTRYIAYTQKLLSIQRTVVSALIYPAILLTLSVALVTLVVFFIIPRFNEFLVDFGADLPMITKIMVAFALFCTGHWQIIVGVLISSLVGLMFWKRTPSGMLFLDRMKLRIPLVGSVMHDYAQNRFTRTLATLQAGGIPLVTTMELSARAAGNQVFERALLEAAEKVREGEALWESLEHTELISDIAIQMIKVGESTGMLVEMLNNASDFTDEEIDTKLTRLISLVEPLMLVFMALVVGLMLMSVYLPLIRAYGQTRGM